MCLFSAITYDTVLQVSVRAPLCTRQSLRIQSGYCIFFTQIRMFLFVTFAQCCCQKNNFNKRCSLKSRNVNINLNFCFVPRGSSDKSMGFFQSRQQVKYVFMLKIIFPLILPERQFSMSLVSVVLHYKRSFFHFLLSSVRCKTALGAPRLLSHSMSVLHILNSHFSQTPFSVVICTLI